MLVLIFIAAAVASYLLGGINGSIITSKYVYKKDIREFGSGNPGLTNFLRVFGKGGVVLVVLIDIMKNALPVFLAGWAVGFIDVRYSFLIREFAGLCVMLGNAFPIYYEFRGGKCVMSIGVVAFFLDWKIALIAWGAFAVVVLLTRYVSLGAIIGVSMIPIVAAIWGLGGIWGILLAAACAALLIARHHENIGRLFKGTESKLSFHKEKPKQA